MPTAEARAIEEKLQARNAVNTLTAHIKRHGKLLKDVAEGRSIYQVSPDRYPDTLIDNARRRCETANLNRAMPSIISNPARLSVCINNSHSTITGGGNGSAAHKTIRVYNLNPHDYTEDIEKLAVHGISSNAIQGRTSDVLEIYLPAGWIAKKRSGKGYRLLSWEADVTESSRHTLTPVTVIVSDTAPKIYVQRDRKTRNDKTQWESAVMSVGDWYIWESGVQNPSDNSGFTLNVFDQMAADGAFTVRKITKRPD